MRAYEFESQDLPSVERARQAIPQILARAQRDYDAWDETDRDTYAGGGICHIIADSVCDVLSDAGIECTPVSCSHEQHVYVAARFAEGIYTIDIPYYIYEQGGGFSWKKLPDVRFEPRDVVFYRVSGDPADWRDYLDEGMRDVVNFVRNIGSERDAPIVMMTNPQNTGARTASGQRMRIEDFPLRTVAVSELRPWEPMIKMRDLPSQRTVASLIKTLQQGGRIPPLLVTPVRGGYRIIDGHHRYAALQRAGIDQAPVRVVDPRLIRYSDEIMEALKITLERYGHLTVKEQAGEERSGSMIMRWQQVTPNKILVQARSGDGSRELGSVEFYRYDPGSKKWTGEALHVAERYRRQGVATAMYDWFRQKFGPIRPSDAQTRDGKSFWQGKRVWEQGVAESLDQPYRIKWERSPFGDLDAIATLEDGSNLLIMFNNEVYQWRVEFYRGDRQDITGEGDAQRIFATVLKAIREFIRRKKPPSIVFGSVKEIDPRGSRTRLYDRMVQRYADDLGYTLQRQQDSSHTVYRLDRQQDVAEGLVNETQTVTRIDSKPITDFASELRAYKHTDDWSQSGIDTGDDSYWRKNNLQVKTTKGLFAGDPKRTALYATGNAHETRYVEFTRNGKSYVYFAAEDVPRFKNRKTYLSVFDAKNFRKLPTGEYFSENPGAPIKQIEITDPFAYIQKQGWNVRITRDLDKVFQQVKDMHQRGKIPYYGGEGMSESQQGVAEGIDPNTFEELDARIIARAAKQIVPTARTRRTPEGYVHVTTEDGLDLYIGAGVADGSISVNIGSGGGAASSGAHKGAVTDIIRGVYLAAVRKYGEPDTPGELTIDHDAGHGVWQHIADKLGLRYAAVEVKESGMAEGRISDLDIDLQDQQWEAVVGRVEHGVRRGEDPDRMSLALYQWATGEMFDMDEELERRGFDSVADLADHIRDHGGRYVPPEFDLSAGGSIKDIQRLPRRRPDDVSEATADPDFMRGHCHVMALALLTLHPDWQLRAHIGWDEDAESDSDYRVDHVYVMAPDGTAYDCRGRFASEQELVGPDETGGTETQFIDYDIGRVREDVARGELRPFSRRDLEQARAFARRLAENFADGKVKGKSRPGRVRRAGASCKGSVTDLRARAQKYGGERGKMYHWCANMKSGRKK